MIVQKRSVAVAVAIALVFMNSGTLAIYGFEDWPLEAEKLDLSSISSGYELVNKIYTTDQYSSGGHYNGFSKNAGGLLGDTDLDTCFAFGEWSHGDTTFYTLESIPLQKDIYDLRERFVYIHSVLGIEGNSQNEIPIVCSKYTDNISKVDEILLNHIGVGKPNKYGEIRKFRKLWKMDLVNLRFIPVSTEGVSGWFTMWGD